ncbi:hypothetical protein [Streptomyces apocyni]|uniref:hypothetical protein n=1 Tax=Streptomyces apocyni TaxID=2654677 RepID=UPI001E6143E4|nr:hypothetical protein [Streptomyces apocyni]
MTNASPASRPERPEGPEGPEGPERLEFADAGEAADVAAFLARLLRYDKAAAVRLQAGGGALAVFGRPPSFEVLAIRTARLGRPRELDVTVSAGELLESVDESVGTALVPEAVTGPPWAGVLPPRAGWQRLPGLPAADEVRRLVAEAVAAFRVRTEELPPDKRTRSELDRIGSEVWSRPVGDTDLPVRAAHAAQALGFLRPPVADGPVAPLDLLGAGAWLRLRTPYGSIALRRAGLGALSVTPT